MLGQWWLPVVCSWSILVPQDSGSEEPPLLIFSLCKDSEKTAVGGETRQGREKYQNIKGSKVTEGSTKVGMNYSLSAVARKSTL